MTLSVTSRLVHEPGAGDGIRARIVSSRAGLLSTAVIHHDAIDLDVSQRLVEAGETIDFVVDIRGTLNHNQYLWTATLRGANASTETSKAPVTWNSRADFTASQSIHLDAWEQLAQALLCSNEFLFVD